jgi:heat-inducible transcriptional repressor
MGEYKDLLMPILDIITESIQSIEDSDVYLDGLSNILDYPEYSNIEKAREFMSVLKEKDTICRT